MSQVIRISDELYNRLAKHAMGFDTPAKVIETILNAYEGNTKLSTNSPTITPATSLDIVYLSKTEEQFKRELLTTKKAYIKIYYTNGSSEVKEWNASRFSSDSSVDGNLRSGYLRGWKKRGIFKAELSVNSSDLD